MDGLDFYATYAETSEEMQKFAENIRNAYIIDKKRYQNVEMKRGLRNADGTGVIIGVTGIGSVQGYTVVDGVKVPMPGRLYYRGIDSSDIAEAHLRNHTFGYEEVVYLLLLGKLPDRDQE